MADYDRNEIEARLNRRLQEIARARRAVVGEETDDFAARDEELADYDQHPGDTGTETFEQELDETRLIRLEQEAEMVKLALQRLAEGKYGISIDSGKPIPPERLQAQPEAIRTLEEQRRWEAAHGGTGTGPVR